MKHHFDNYFWQVIHISAEQFKLQQQKELSADFHLRHIGYYSAAPQHYCRRTGEDDVGHVLIYCLSNSGWVEYGGQRHEVSAGQIFVLPQHQAHSYGSSEEDSWEIQWVHFQGRRTDAFMEEIGPGNWGRPLEAGRGDSLRQQFQSILDMMENPGENVFIYASMLLWSWLGAFLFDVYLEEKKKPLMIENSILYMNENLYGRLTLKQLSAASALSIPRYSALFKEHAGASPIDYFIELKMEKARALLVQSESRVSEVAVALGYKDPFYFSRVFTKVVGYSPSEYKARESDY